MRIYIGINKKAKEEIQTVGKTKLPYLKLAIPPEQDGGEWKEVAVAWMNDKKTGFNLKLSPGWDLVFQETPEMQTERENKEFKERARIEALKLKEKDEPKIVYPEDDVDIDKIPF